MVRDQWGVRLFAECGGSEGQSVGYTEPPAETGEDLRVPGASAVVKLQVEAAKDRESGLCFVRLGTTALGRWPLRAEPNMAPTSKLE